jgi:thiamine biosynthesis lipoprotein
MSDQQVSLGIPNMQLTLDGIAKGRVVDAGVAALKKFGFDQVLVEAGGDLYALGLNHHQQPWRIALMHPRAKAKQPWLTTLSVRNRAVATSGDYLNSYSADYSINHIIDPRLGVSAVELCSATVLARDTAQADAFGTALMVLGVEAGLDFVEKQAEVECLLVSKDLSCHPSSGFPTG